MFWVLIDSLARNVQHFIMVMFKMCYYVDMYSVLYPSQQFI